MIKFIASIFTLVAGAFAIAIGLLLKYGIPVVIIVCVLRWMGLL